jgi:hypothetical protein
MNAQDLTLNIAVNLGRLSRFASEGKEQRIRQFIDDTDFYIQELEKTPQKDRFKPTFQKFTVQFNKLKNNIKLDRYWAEDMLTWANILTHRAKLA